MAEEKKVGFVTMGEAKEVKEIPILRIGILGYAFMGKSHSNAYKKMNYIMYPPPALAELYAICGRNEEAVKTAAKRYGYKKYYTDWKELVKDPDVDVFDNSGPNNVHYEPTLKAIENGKHIFCEKPLALNSKQGKELFEKAQEKGIKHMVDFNYRFVPAIRLAKEIVESGKIGTIYHFRAQYLQEWIIDPNFPLVWRLRKDIAGSGALGDLGSHIIDIARFLVGEIASVMAQTRTFIKERPLPEDPSKKGKVDVDDAFAAVVEFENGAIGTLEASRFCHGRKNYQYWEINGSKGSIRFNLERLNELEVYLAKEGEAKLVGARDIMVTESYHPYMEHWWPHGHIIGWEHAQVHAIYHLFDCIVNDKNVEPWGASFRDGYRALVVEEAILRSAEIGKRVDITYEI